MIADGIAGGKTQAAASWLMDSLKEGERQTFHFPIGSGAKVVIGEMLRQWRTSHPDGIAIVLTSVPAMRDDWNRRGLDSIALQRADMEMRRDGTLMGHPASDIGLIVADEVFPGQISRRDDLLARFPSATILQMHVASFDLSDSRDPS